MATMSIRVDDDLRDEIEEVARGDGLSVSEFVRNAIETRLGREVGESDSSPRTLARTDRLQQSLLHRILQLLETDEPDASYHGAMTEVLRRGYAGEYCEEFVAIDDELSYADCRFVWDVLDMFRVARASVAALSATDVGMLDEHAETSLRLGGFDLNDSREGRMLSYARYLIDIGKWEELAVHFDDAHERGNSHSPRLETYQRMLEVYEPIWHSVVSGTNRGRSDYLLNVEELRQVALAWYHPSRRPTDG